MKDYKIEITIPVLNEETTLKNQVYIIRNYLDTYLTDFGPIRIVIADNGSTDATQKTGQELQSQLLNVEYLRLEKRGVGLALKKSWQKSSASIVGYMDLDLATDLSHLREAFNAILIDNADIVTGSRLLKGASVIGRSKLRGFTSRGFNLCLKIAFQNKFSDGMCGFKFLKSSILPKLIARGADSDGWFFATEILVIAENLKYKLAEIPVKWTDDPNSKVKILNLSFEYLKSIKRLFFKLRRSN